MNIHTNHEILMNTPRRFKSYKMSTLRCRCRDDVL